MSPRIGPALILVAVALAPLTVLAAPPEAGKAPLALPTLRRLESKPRAPAKLAGCPGIQAASVPGGLPFAVGEELAYDVTVKGVLVGRFETKVGRPRTVEGRPVLALFGRARTGSFASQFEKFVGRYMSFIDAATLRPHAVQTESDYGADHRRERARFASGERTVRAEFRAEGRDGQRLYDREAPLFDLLSALFYARTRALGVGEAACQEVYADRRLWRVDAKVLGPQTIGTPAGDKVVQVLTTTWERLAHPDFNPKVPPPRVEVDLFLSTDGTRTPLAFRFRAKKVEAEGTLVGWSLAGDEREESWTF